MSEVGERREEGGRELNHVIMVRIFQSQLIYEERLYLGLPDLTLMSAGSSRRLSKC